MTTMASYPNTLMRSAFIDFIYVPIPTLCSHGVPLITSGYNNNIHKLIIFILQVPQPTFSTPVKR